MDKKLFEALVESFKEADKLKRERRQTINWRQHISVDPHIMHGTAWIAQARLPVSVVLHNLACGLSKDELIAEFPSLTHDGIVAALAYAAELTRERVITLP